MLTVFSKILSEASFSISVLIETFVELNLGFEREA